MVRANGIDGETLQALVAGTDAGSAWQAAVAQRIFALLEQAAGVGAACHFKKVLSVCVRFE